MKIFSRGRQLGQAVKNVQRLRHILAVFVKYGFIDILDRMNLSKFLPGRLGAYAALQADRTLPHRLRLAFEELGPAFVKLGQLLATRTDLIPEPFINEFVQLQEHVQPLDFFIVKSVLEAELVSPLEKFFEHFNPAPIGVC